MAVFDGAVQLIVNLEGGLSLDPDDNGNWAGGQKGKGQLLGTKYGISAASYPHLDIPNLTADDAKAIYRRDYWDAIGGDSLPPQLAVVALDTAINSGVGTAKRLLAESTGLLDFIGRRFLHYTSLEQWPLYGRGWTRRFAEIVRFAGTLTEAPADDRLLVVLGRDNQEVARVPLGSADVLMRASADGQRVYVRPDES